jgi:hypothetical protein
MELISHITLSIIEAADSSIPIKSGISGRPPLPWFSDECRYVRRRRLRAERDIKRKFSIANKIAYNRSKAQNRYIIKKSRRESWQEFVGSINSRTSLHSAWKKAAKISGKFSPTPTPVLKLPTGETVRAHDDVASQFAESLASVTGDQNYSNEFLRYKAREERKQLSFNSRGANHFKYNEPLTLKELNHAIAKAKDGSPGPDKITFMMIKHLHQSMKELILATFNRIYNEQKFPTSWAIAIVIQIAKEGKDLHNP